MAGGAGVSSSDKFYCSRALLVQCLTGKWGLGAKVIDHRGVKDKPRLTAERGG